MEKNLRVEIRNKARDISVDWGEEILALVVSIEKLGGVETLRVFLGSYSSGQEESNDGHHTTGGVCPHNRSYVVTSLKRGCGTF